MNNQLTSNGLALCVLLPWDTELYGFKIARLIPTRLTATDCESALTWAREQGIKCLYWLVDPSCHESARVAGLHEFTLVDVRVTLEYRSAADKNRPLDPCLSETVRIFESEDRSELYGLVSTAFYQSRFYFDPGFPRDKVNQMYRTWIDKCIDSNDGHVQVTGTSQITGCLACTARDGEVHGTIELIAVAPHSMGKGLGKALVECALAFARERNLSRMEVATQARNIAAQRLYVKSGFIPLKQELWFHRWL